MTWWNVKTWKPKPGRWKRLTVGVVAVLVTITALTLTARWLWPYNGLDVKNSSDKDLAGFLTGRDFANLSDIQRRAWLKSLASRYMQMSIDDQHAFTRLCRDDHIPDYLLHQLWDLAGMAIAKRLADHYMELSPTDRTAFLDATFLIFSHTPSLKREGDNIFTGKGILKTFREDRGKVQASIVNFQSLLTSSTSAPERAAINDITKGLAQRWETLPK